jgi:hypothetical protein
MTPELLSIWQRHAVLVNGAINPQGIPYGVAMDRMFLELPFPGETGQEASQQKYQQMLRLRFPVTDADAQRVADVARSQVDALATVKNDSSRSYDQVCAQLVSTHPERASALDFATQFEAIERDEAERLMTHYKAALNDLSPAARSALDAYVDTEIRPGLGWGHDLVGLASEVPEAFLAQR